MSPRRVAALLTACSLLAAVLGFAVGSLTADVTDQETTGEAARPTDAVAPVPPPAGGTCPITPADGQAAITAAIEACPDGSTVLFPSRAIYHQSDEILVKGRTNLVIDGNDSTFVSSAPNEPDASLYDARPNWELVEGTGVTLRNMNIRGNLEPRPRGMMPGNQFNAGIIIYGGDGVFVTDVSVSSVFGEFVVANPSGVHYGGGALDGQVPTNIRISGLRGENAARQCVAATAAVGFWLEDSTLSGCFQNGVDIEPDVAGEPIRDVHILRNAISGYYASAITVPTAYGPGDVDGVEIRGNTTLSASDTCFPAVLVGGVQENTNLLLNIVIADNRLKTMHDGVKITYVGSGSVTGNDITLTASPDLCAPPVPVPVRAVSSPNVLMGSNLATQPRFTSIPRRVVLAFLAFLAVHAGLGVAATVAAVSMARRARGGRRGDPSSSDPTVIPQAEGPAQG